MMPAIAPGSAFITRLSLVFALLFSSAHAQAAPRIVASIKPLQLIAAAITEGVATPVTVWAQGQDPHHVSLRPSERRLLADADLVLWTGPMLEQPLAALVDDLDAEVLTVQDVDGLMLIEVEGQPDPHVWVDTRNARLIAAALADMLVELDAENAALYRGNLANFNAALETLGADLKQRFSGTAQQEWAVYHHALRYLEREFALLPPVLLADSENNAPGLRTARQVREQLQQKGITCMLAEPGVNHDEVLTMLDLPALRLVDADVMGRGADAGDYATYMRALAATVGDCLGTAP